MPLYEYVCQQCKIHFTKRLPVEERDSSPACPNDHIDTHRQFSIPVIIQPDPVKLARRYSPGNKDKLFI